MRLTIILASLLTYMVLPLVASADEQLTPLVVDGDWAALEHRESMEDPPDICIAAELANHFFIRADSNDIEIRYSDSSWSLPANVTGTMNLAVNGDSYPLPITDNTNDMVIATISQDQLQKIVADMNKAGSMAVTPGSGSATTISLSGSNQAVTAFLTCAGISQPGNTGGSNPFQSSSGSGNSQ